MTPDNSEKNRVDEVRTAQVLVVEDESDMARVLEFNLERRGYDCVLAETLAAARNAFATRRPDLVLLDLRLPDGSGLDFLAELQSEPETRAVPVLVASALGEEDTVVQALESGAEDYVVKPFRVGELMARVARVLRRRVEARHAEEPESMAAGEVAIVPETRTVTVAGKVVEFTRTEFDLVAHFVKLPVKVWTRKQLCDLVLEAGGAVQERTIDAHIRTIRRKLGAAGGMLQTVWGVGYKLVAEES
ncbi:MAG: response regulator transcription factor [Lentisphaeria bacterium]|nr:response regulator transcription factor [Lentisphaeria bacterium]